MPQVDDLSRSLVAFDQDASLIVVVEMSEASWLVAGMAPGVDRQPLKKLGPDPDALLRLVERWRDEAVKAGKMIERIALAFEAGRDGFWLARWLQARGIEVHVIHSTSVAVSREHRRAKTDRLDTAMLMRVFLGWLRSERGHCGMVAIPTLEDEDARRPSRERESLVGERTRIINRMKAILAWLGVRGFNPKLRKAPQRLDDLRTPEDLPLPPNTVDELRRDMARLAMVCEQIKALEQARLANLEQAPGTGPHAMVRLIANVIGVGIETADMLVQEVLSRNLRDRRAVARFAGLTGAPNERFPAAREGVGEVRQCPGEARLDPACLALPAVPEGQCARPVAPRADRRSDRRAEDEDDRGARAKAAHRVLAHGHGRRNPGRLRVAAAGLRRSARKLKQAVRRPLGFSRMAVDDPRWR